MSAPHSYGQERLDLHHFTSQGEVTPALNAAAFTIPLFTAHETEAFTAASWALRESEGTQALPAIAQQEERPRKKLWWIVGGAATIVVTSAILLSTGGSSSGDYIPEPPGRP